MGDDVTQAHCHDTFICHILYTCMLNDMHLYRKSLFLLNKKAETRLRLISSADGGKERKKAGKLISNMFIFFSEGKGRELGGRKQ